jgi:very-short-patch-repair endonuclease
VQPPKVNSLGRGFSDWERVFYRHLLEAGLRPIPQYAEEKFLLDFALFDESRKLNIEVDGERYHRDWNGELLRRDQLRNMRLIELGWDVMRFWVYQLRDEVSACVQRVNSWHPPRAMGGPSARWRITDWLSSHSSDGCGS